MNISFDKSFYKSLDKLHDKSIAKSLEEILISLQKAKSLSDVRNIKKLRGFKNFYRIRIGDYRLGFELEKAQSIRMIVLAHRKDVYKKFP
jgi:mRNA interferase RelE/StbE